MKVAVINHGIFPYLLGGMERHTSGLANALVDLGADVDVIVPTIDAQAKSNTEAPEFRFKLVELEWPKVRPWLRANYLFSANVRSHIQTKSYDCIYCQGFNGWAYLETATSEQPLTIYNPHGMEMFKTVGWWQTLKHLHMRTAARKQAKYAKLTVSLGGYLTDQVKRFLGVQESRVVILPNAIDLGYIDSLMGESVALPVKPGKVRRYVFVGRLEANKGIGYLCEAFRELSHAELFVVGGGPLENALRAEYAGRRIYFKGRVSDRELFTLYRESDAFVFSSLYEGMPTVILEAMASRLPIIATDIGAVRTMVDEENGFVVKPKSSSALRVAVEEFNRLPKDRVNQMRQASRERVTSNFTWEAIAKKTLDVINKHAHH